MHWPLTIVQHGALVLAGLLIYLTSTRLTHQHRHPSSALAWVLTLVLLPYLGIPLYLLFGVRKVPRPRLVPHHPDPSWPTQGPAWAFSLSHALSLPAPAHNQAIAFHADGQLALDALLALIDEARHSIAVCSFVMGHDAVADQLAAALRRAASRGVQVRVLLDGLGCWSTARGLRARLKAPGLTLRFFMPVLPNKRQGRVNLRNHRKLVIVDGHTVWSGGRNLAAEYFLGHPPAPAWADISFTIQGPLAAQAQGLYQLDWRAASGAPTPAEPGAIPLADGAWRAHLAQWLPSGPDHADDTVYALLMAAAYRAERHLVLVSPYFVPDDALLSAWCMACRRGVTLTLVIPARSNHRLADLARSPSLRTLLACGADVRLYPGMLHAKAVIVDEALALCGSVNLDSRSLFLNYELNTAFYDPSDIAWLTAWSRGLADLSQPARFARPSAAREMLEGLVRIVGFQL